MNEPIHELETMDSKTGELMPIDQDSLALGLSRAEIDTQIATAKRYPRDLRSVHNRLLSYVTLDDETAEECGYALPRGGKPITGPSIRFAEALKAAFGNCRVAARVVHVDRTEKVVIAEGIFHDLETNSATRAEVRRRIVDKNGRLYKDDMIIVTGNAAASIALRNAILGGVPKPVWRRAYEQVQRIIKGDTKTLVETREKAIKALANFGVTPEQIFLALGVTGQDDVTVDHIPVLRGMFSALKNGEATVEEMFHGTVSKSIGHQKIDNPLADEPATADTGTEVPKEAVETTSADTPQEPQGASQSGEAEVGDSDTGETVSAGDAQPDAAGYAGETKTLDAEFADALAECTTAKDVQAKSTEWAPRIEDAGTEVKALCRNKRAARLEEIAKTTTSGE